MFRREKRNPKFPSDYVHCANFGYRRYEFCFNFSCHAYSSSWEQLVGGCSSNWYGVSRRLQEIWTRIKCGCIAASFVMLVYTQRGFYTRRSCGCVNENLNAIWRRLNRWILFVRVNHPVHYIWSMRKADVDVVDRFAVPNLCSDGERALKNWQIRS